MKQSKAGRHGNCIEYNCCCTVQNIHTILYHYLFKISQYEDFSILAMSLYQSHTLLYYLLSVPPRMTSYSDNQTVNEGSNLRLFCNATGRPAPNITWIRVSDDEVLFAGNPWYIVNINRTYSGTYRCVADNRVPSPVNSTISINVLCEYSLYYQLPASLILI